MNQKNRSTTSSSPIRDDQEKSTTNTTDPHPDSVRLDWIYERIHGTGQSLTVGGSCYWSVSIGRTRIGEGDDLREAIDDAMEAEGPSRIELRSPA